MLRHGLRTALIQKALESTHLLEAAIEETFGGTIERYTRSARFAFSPQAPTGNPAQCGVQALQQLERRTIPCRDGQRSGRSRQR